MNNCRPTSKLLKVNSRRSCEVRSSTFRKSAVEKCFEDKFGCLGYPLGNVWISKYLS